MRHTSLLLLALVMAGCNSGASPAPPTAVVTDERTSALGAVSAAAARSVSARFGPAPAATSARPPRVIGERRVLVMLVNFKDQPDDRPFSSEEVHRAFFDQAVGASGFLREASYGQAWYSGDVTDWFTVPLPHTTNEYDRLADFAVSAAEAAGWNLSAYAHHAFVFPYLAVLPWKGLGTVGGEPARAWLNGTIDVVAVAHELGHGLGLDHAHAREVIGTSSVVLGYGDTFDVMGSGPPVAHFNGFAKERLGWLDAASVTDAGNGGTFTLAPLESPSGMRLLKVPAGSTSSGKPRYLYVEARRPIGFDAFVAERPNVANGVLIREADPTNGDSCSLLDATPAPNTWDDPGLAPGVAFVDSQSGVSIEVLQSSVAGATVRVEVPPELVAATPRVEDVPIEEVASYVFSDGSSVRGLFKTRSALGGAGSLELVRVNVTTSSGLRGAASAVVSFECDATGRQGRLRGRIDLETGSETIDVGFKVDGDGVVIDGTVDGTWTIARW